MQSFLCAEFLDFAASQLGRSGDPSTLPSCDPVRCSGLGHLKVLAEAAGARCGEPAALLLRRFGSALFGPLVRRYPAFLLGMDSTVELVARFDAHVAGEIAKLAPGVQLPQLAVVRRRGHAVEITCRSRDGLADLVEGLLAGSVRHFAEPLLVESCTRPAAVDGIAAVFVLRPRPRTDLRGRSAPPVPSCRPPPRA
jgi:hypothetical protein